MRLSLRTTLQVAAVAGGLWLLGAGVANADSPEADTSVTACDNYISGVDADCVSTSDSGGSTPADEQSTETGQQDDTSGAGGNGSGNQVNPHVNAPITVCGNSIAVLEDGSAECSPSESDDPSGDNTTSGEGGVVSGNQINPVINTPITVCGNSIGVLAESDASCEPSGQGPSASPGNTTTGEDGVLSGNQINPVINAPITVCGNAISVLGESTAQCKPTGQGIGSTGGNTTNGEDGVLSGNQVNPPVNAPITVCGNAVDVLGKSSADCRPAGQGIGSTGDNTTNGDEGTGSGNQLNPDVNAPMLVCGNAVSVGGEASAECAGGGATPPGPGTPPANPPGPGTPPANPPSPDAPSGPPSAAVPGDASGLPVTGTDTWLLGLLGLLFMLLGAALVRLGRGRLAAVRGC